MRTAIPELKKLKVGDQVVVETSGFSSGLYMGTVLKRTATRFTVKYDNSVATFTVDGYPYPFSYSGPKVSLATEERIALCKKSNAIRMMQNAAYKFDNALRRSPQWYNVTTEQLVTLATLTEVIALELQKKD